MTPTSSVPSQYLIPYTSMTISHSILRVTQIALGACFVGGLTLQQTYRTDDCPTWIYPLTIGMGVLSVVGLSTSFFLKRSSLSPIDQRLADHTGKFFTCREIEELQLVSLVHELCEKEIEGDFRRCSHIRMQEILDYLKKHDLLNALNTIPEMYFSDAPGHRPFPFLSILYTPLHYWSAQGDLEKAQLLVDHGALDYFDCEAVTKYSGMKSALYMAALGGHTAVVEYLLQKGARANIAFRHNLLLSFIPHFIFDLCQLIEFGKGSETAVDCLEKILLHLQKEHSNNLRQQLKIPIEQDKNSLDWIKSQSPQ